jgi:hypothetical protein
VRRHSRYVIGPSADLVAWPIVSGLAIHAVLFNAAASALVLVADFTGWLSLAVGNESPATQKNREERPMNQQLKDSMPALNKPQPEEGDYTPVCGNCMNHIQARAAWRCKTRLFLIDLDAQRA